MIQGIFPEPVGEQSVMSWWCSNEITYIYTYIFPPQYSYWNFFENLNSKWLEQPQDNLTYLYNPL